MNSAPRTRWLDGGLTLNGDVFFYNYTGYQISRIVDRTAINDNFNATVKGAELEAMYEPIPGLKFNFAGGYEDTRIDNGQSSVDLMDRTAGMPGWMVVKPFVTQAVELHPPGLCDRHGTLKTDPRLLGRWMVQSPTRLHRSCAAAYDR